MLPFNIGPGELLLILAIALLVIGPGRLPDVGASLGKALREFRKASSEMQDAVTSASAAASAAPSSTARPAAPPTAVVAPTAVSVPPVVTPAVPASTPALADAATLGAVADAPTSGVDADAATPSIDASAVLSSGSFDTPADDAESTPGA